MSSGLSAGAFPVTVEDLHDPWITRDTEYGAPSEAGPTGYHLARALDTAGISCEVLAPSKLIRPAGDRVKTDKRDAVFLARTAALGEYVPVRVPDPDEEAARDLVRARDDARRELMTARHHLSKLLLRHGFVYPAKTTWDRDHDRWLRQTRAAGLAGGGAGSLAAFDDAYDDICHTLARPDRLDGTIADEAATSRFAPTVDRLCCLRGVSTLTGYALAVEMGDWDRFTPTSIGAYLRLCPSEHSSGQSRAQGGITRAGNAHARRLLVESAWLHAAPYRAGKTLRRRWKKAPEPSQSMPTKATGACMPGGSGSPPGRRRAPRSPLPLLARNPAGAGCWRPWTAEATRLVTDSRRCVQQRVRDRTSAWTVSSLPAPGGRAMLDLRRARTSPAETLSCGHDPRISD